MANIRNNALCLLSLVAGIFLLPLFMLKLLLKIVHLPSMLEMKSKPLTLTSTTLWRATSEQSNREDALAEDPRLSYCGLDTHSHATTTNLVVAYAVIDVRETYEPVLLKTPKMVHFRWHVGAVKAPMWRG